MTTEHEVSPQQGFVAAILPWVVAAGALGIYLVTLNRWVSLSSLEQVATAAGWNWRPEVYGPLYWLVTYPFRWLPARVIPLALNSFAAVCAALSLALLARSVALLPHDRTHGQRQQESSRNGFLSISTAWLPPVLATLVCGLQLTFWEHATAISSQPPPWGSGCEMLDLLLFAYVIRCLLEFRVAESESWLLRAALAYGAAMTNNWAMIGFLPAFLLAVIWIRGLGFFDLRFLGRMSFCGLLGLLLYLLLPVILSAGDASSAGFWPALKANLGAQRSILMAMYKHGRHEVALLALTSLLPVFIFGIRWASYFGDTSQLGVRLATFMFHFVHALFLVACTWVALDPPFSPRNKSSFGLPFLTFYYLGAIAVGYCSGYFLVLFRGKTERRRRVPGYARLINTAVTAAIWLLLVLAPVALVYRNLPQIRTTNGPLLRQFAGFMAESLPAQHTVVLSDDARRLFLLRAHASQSGKDWLFLDTTSLVWPAYHRFLKRQYPAAWESNPPKGIAQRAEPLMLVELVSRLAQTNSLYYLHPSFGYYFEFFYLEPQGLVYQLKPYLTNRLTAPLASQAVVTKNEAFWAKADPQALQPLLALVAPSKSGTDSGVMDWLARQAHLVREPNADATTLAAFYSRALDWWGVEMQKSGHLTGAATHFERAVALNSDNVVAQVNLQCNQNLRANRKSSVQVPKSIEDEFGKYRNWDQVVGENGPFDEPNFCYEQGHVFVNNNLYRQAAAEFDRVRTLAPENLAARIWLAQLHVLSQMPGEALKLVEEIHALPNLQEAISTNRANLLFVEASARLGQNDLKRAEAAVHKAVAQQPGDAELLARASEVFLRYGRYTNALVTIDEELQLAPTNMTALVNKGLACIQVGAFEQAIVPLTRALEMDTNNYAALFNRAIANLRGNQLEAAQQDYELLQKTFPAAHQIYYGLAEVAWRKRDTNAAIRNYQLYLANAQTNTAEAKLVSARLKELKSGSR